MKNRIPMMMVALCMLMSFSGKCWAYQAVLDNKTFQINGAASQHKLIVSNTDKNPVAIEISVVSRSIDTSGNETTGPIPSDWFIVYPAQLILKPGEEEVVKIAWANKIKVDKELAFRVAAAQVYMPDPEEVKRRADGSKWDVKIDFLTRYMLSAFVCPEGTKPRVLLKDPQVIEKNEGTLARVVFENTGSKHRSMKDIKITLTSLLDNGEQNKSVQPAEFSNLPAVVLLPGLVRDIDLTLPKGFPKGKIRADYTYQEVE